MLTGADQNKLRTVSPQLRQATSLLIADAARYGADVGVVEALRSAARQRDLYAIGRRGVPGERPVTWTLDSRHITGEAVDLTFRSGGRLTYEVPAWWWEALGFLGERQGLTRPALSRGDLGHFELRRR